MTEEDDRRADEDIGDQWNPEIVRGRQIRAAEDEEAYVLSSRRLIRPAARLSTRWAAYDAKNAKRNWLQEWLDG